MSRWFEQRSAWQLFAIVWTGIMACGVIEYVVHDHGHLGTGTLKHLAFYSVFMAASVTAGIQLGKRNRARRRGANPGK
jgi:hypothetical protein